jgi:mono/diheme cytochrome c family protein
MTTGAPYLQEAMLMLRVLFLTFVLGLAVSAANTGSTKVTFHKDVLPVLQRNCQQCHRPGEAAPMSFLTYKETRPWAKAIKAAVATRKMPPWPADPLYGQFANERRLTEDQLNTLVAWADTGAAEGNAADAPPLVGFLEGWNIEKPDRVFEMPSVFEVPPTGTIDYNYIIIPTGFTKDTWVEQAEVRPGNREVVHHVIAFIRHPGSPWMKDAKPGIPFVPEKRSPRRRNANAEGGDDGAGMSGVELLAGYAPGLPEQKFRPGQGRLVPAGSDIVLQLHYTANGKPATDRTKVGLVYAKQEPKQRIITLTATNARFAIPAGDPNHEVKSAFTLHDTAELVWLMPHMHLRGKDFEYRAVYPTGETEILLRVPSYDFNWQLAYDLAKAKTLPKGTRIECTAHFDNSANNPANPDPTKVVRWGDQSWEEMMIGWFGVAIDAKADPVKLFVAEKAKKTTRSSD